MNLSFRNRLIVAFLWLALCPTFRASAQSGPPFAHARQLGMGSVSVALTDAEVIGLQPAALGSLDAWTTHLGGIQYFWLPDIRTGNFHLGIPAGKGGFGLQGEYFGFEAFNETRLGLAYGRQLSENLQLGGRLLYRHQRIPEYGTANRITFDLGLQYQADEHWQFGGYVYHPIQNQPDNDFLATTMRFGVAHRFSPRALLAAEVEKTFGYDLRIRGGLEYFPAPTLCILLGVQSNPATFSLGVGWKSNAGLRIDLVQEYHLMLGLSPGLSLTYQLPSS